MSYQTKIAPEAKKELRALPAYVRAQAYQLIDTLETTPRPPRAKELRGKPGIYRLWLAGRWRIVYSVNDDTRTVRIIRIRRKEQIDYEEV